MARCLLPRGLWSLVVGALALGPSSSWAQDDEPGVGDKKGVKLSGNETGPSPEEALALYQRLAQDEPQNAEYHQLLAVAYAELGRLDAARREAKEAIRLTSDGSEMWQALGLIEEKAKNYPAALEAFDRAIGIHGNVEYRLDRARILGLMGKPAEEAAAYEAIATEFGSDVDVLHGLAEYFREQALYDEAHKYYDQALALSPKDKDDLVAILTNKGKAYGDQGRLQESMSALTRARAANPRDAEVLYNLGIVYFRLKQYDAAQQAFEAAIKEKPDFARAHNNLGVVLERKKQNELALAAFDEAAKHDAAFAEAHFNKGLAAFKLTRWQQAEQAFLKTLEVDPDFADAKFYLGETYYQLKEPSKALAVYKEALRMNPNDADTHRRLGDVYLEKGEIDLAIGEYWAAVDADDRIQENIRQLMLVLMTRNAEGDVRRAAKLGESALEKDPFAADTRAVLAQVYMRLGRALSARQVLEKGIQVAPKSARMHAAYGAFLLEDGTKLREAELEFEAALRLDPRAHDAKYGLGRVELSRGNKPKAIQRIQEALSLHPGFAEARAQLGCIYMYQREYGKALDELKRATEDDPNSGLAWFCRGYATYNDASKPAGLDRDALEAHRDRQKEDAEGFFRKAVAVEPSRGEAWHFLGELLRRKGDLPGAKAMYKRAVDLGYDKSIIELEKLRDVK